MENWLFSDFQTFAASFAERVHTPVYYGIRPLPCGDWDRKMLINFCSMRCCFSLVTIPIFRMISDASKVNNRFGRIKLSIWKNPLMRSVFESDMEYSSCLCLLVTWQRMTSFPFKTAQTYAGLFVTWLRSVNGKGMTTSSPFKVCAMLSVPLASSNLLPELFQKTAFLWDSGFIENCMGVKPLALACNFQSQKLAIRRGA